MTNRIVSVKPVDGTVLLVGFQNGIEKTYDVKNMFTMFPQLQILEKDQALFKHVAVDVGGYGLYWNDELDIDANEIWENGKDTEKVVVTDVFSQIGYSLVTARDNIKMTQKELSDKTGIDQANISKIERGTANPSLSTLKRLAEGVGMKLKIEFVPIQERLQK